MRVYCISLEPTKSTLLPELVDLSNDEESCVRLAALETIVSLLSLLDDGKFDLVDSAPHPDSVGTI